MRPSAWSAPLSTSRITTVAVLATSGATCVSRIAQSAAASIAPRSTPTTGSHGAAASRRYSPLGTGTRVRKDTAVKKPTISETHQRENARTRRSRAGYLAALLQKSLDALGRGRFGVDAEQRLGAREPNQEPTTVLGVKLVAVFCAHAPQRGAVQVGRFGVRY